MTKAHQEIIEFMAGGSTSADVASFKPSAKARRKVAALIAKEKNTGLLPEEKRELDEYMQLEHLMRLAKARARQLLSRE
ncbi:MAG: hypothetical protein ACKVY0_28485 [Prosthecobacter sp.]|uniref:hypothetical protein n=1 Tax=Prosthecobacter sp. TaxID=1965333 RepID=UPI0038FFF428